jgi:hypothetical protein
MFLSAPTDTNLPEHGVLKGFSLWKCLGSYMETDQRSPCFSLSRYPLTHSTVRRVRVKNAFPATPQR